MMENMLPRHMEIIYLINHHFMNVSDENLETSNLFTNC